jgi:uncharacterized membrane protein required for colicin V production
MQDLELLWTTLAGDLGWVDLSSLTVVALFALLGLVRGLVWQVGRALTLIGSFAASVSLAPALAQHVFAGAPLAMVHSHVAHVLVFLAAYLVLAALARGGHALVRRSRISVFDRLAGGLLGVGTGAALTLALLALALMFGQRLPLYHVVQESRTLALGRTAVRALGDVVPASVQQAFAPPDRGMVKAAPSVATGGARSRSESPARGAAAPGR